MSFHWLNTSLLRRFYGTETPPPDTLPPEHTGPEYRLLRWPDLPDALHTAEVMGALSVMSSRPVTAYWFAHRVRWRTWKAIEFLEGLCIAGDACQVADGEGQAIRGAASMEADAPTQDR